MRLLVLILLSLPAGASCHEGPEQSADRHLINGILYESEFQYEEAIKEYEKGGDSVIVLNKIAALYNKLRKHDEALAALKKAISLDKDNAEAHFDLAGTYYNMRRFDDAVKAYERVLELNPESVPSLDSLGNIHQDLGKLDEAIGYYRRAVTAQVRRRFF